MTELIDTEQSYVQDLGYVVKVRILFIFEFYNMAMVLQNNCCEWVLIYVYNSVNGTLDMVIIR